MKRFFLILMTLVGLAAGVSIWLPPQPHGPLLAKLSSAVPSFLDNGDQAAYRKVAVERGDIIETVRAAGTLNALVLVEVGSQISGQIRDLSADFNSPVTKGQVIARVEPEIYEAKLAQAQAEVEMAETMVAVQRAQIRKDQAAIEDAKAAEEAGQAETMRVEVLLDDAKKELERKRPLVKHSVVSTGEWDRVQNAYKAAQAKVIASHAEEASKVAAVRAAEAALKMAESQLINAQATSYTNATDLSPVRSKHSVLRTWPKPQMSSKWQQRRYRFY